jgi:uncharacterized Zn finger protein
MSWFEWRPYVSVAQRRQQAARKLAKLTKQGQRPAPVRIEGRKIAATFWGQSWCANLERYSDFASRLPRGRSYVRNGSVIDLQIAKGEVAAKVLGSQLYTIKIAIAPVAAVSWKSICRDCAGTIDSLVELLQGRLAKHVMDRVCRKGDGLFPSPHEIKLSCSCPDWADMCKHVAAALYGVGARLDQQPRLLFVLRGVDEQDLLAGAGQTLPLAKPTTDKVLADDDVAALFGLDMVETAAADPAPAAPSKQSKASRRRKTSAGKASADGAAAARKAAHGRRSTSKPARIRRGKKRAARKRRSGP